jgi:replicative DNA helicase
MPESPVGNGPLFGQSLRTPPTNIQAEQALLGAIMSNGKALHAVVEFLKPDHFADHLHGRIYREATRRIMAGGVADAIALDTWFAADPESHAAGGRSYLSGLLASMVGIINAREYGHAIHECWQRRQLIALGEEVVNWSFGAEPGDGVGSMVSSTIDRLDGVLAESGSHRKAVTMDESMDQAISAAQHAATMDGHDGVSTGMQSVDDVLGGLEPQTLSIIAGRPGMGKSALGWMWAVHAARDAKAAHDRGEPPQGVFVVSLEMSAKQLGRRALAAISGVPLAVLKRGRLSQSEWDRVILARKELAGLPLSIEDCSNLSVGLVRLKARAARRRHGLGLIMIDHLHIMKPEDADARNGGTWAIGRISNGLKQLAKEFECPVLALAQLNRNVEGRDDKRPTLADLRQAGEIEQDADAVAFVYRGEYYLKGEPERRQGEMADKFAQRCTEFEESRQRLRGKAELIVEKVRDGSPCTVPLLWDAATTHFSEPTP